MRSDGIARRLSLVCLAIAVCACGSPPEPTRIDWRVEGPVAFEGAALEISGSPSAIETSQGTALHFDGEGDALFVDRHPLEGARTFTVEMFFRPDSGGRAEQRVLHLQEEGSSDRILLETRLVGDRWFMDSYVKSDDEGYTLFAKHRLHRLDRWFHVALVVDGKTMRQFVDGKLEMERPIEFLPPRDGMTSLGVRANRVDWFKGAVKRVRFTPRALEPGEFFLAETPGG